MFRIKAAVVVAVIASLFAVTLPLSVMADPISTLLLPELGLMQVTSVYEETFDSPDAWEAYVNPSGVELGVMAGTYRAYAANPGFVWGLNDIAHEDVVLEVEVTPMTMFTDNGAGVVCRADASASGDGYYFMITNDGYFSIRKGEGDGMPALVDWQYSPAIHTGLDVNTVRAVCLEDHLAMYVNDQFVALVEDATYTSGRAGLAVAAGSNSVDMAFDNLTLYDVALGPAVSGGL